MNWNIVRIPESCRGVDIIIGIDEAGRGPVLGPLVYTAAFWPVSENDKIQNLGFNDSKQLKESDREKFFEIIRSHPSIGWVIEEISAADISKDMLKASPISLNSLSYDAVIRILTKINNAGPVSPEIGDIFIDTVGDADFYKSRLIHGLGDHFGNFTIEKKADAKYKVVGAASIIAKVHRDTVLKEWKWVEPSLNLDKNFGSGYPGDENCVKWLNSAIHHVFGFPNLIRFSWSTSRVSLENNKVCLVEWACDEDESTSSMPTIQSFFTGGEKTKKTKRSSFFTQRKMRRVSLSDFMNHN